MARAIEGKQIDRVVILDDNKASRQAIIETVADGNVNAVPVDGPLRGFDEAIRQITTTGDALVSDLHLTEGRYADFDGARVVAEVYRRGFPGVLYTAWAEPKLDEIRRYRRWMPAVIDCEDATDPEAFFLGFQLCLKEFSGHFSATRKPWRVLVRVEEAILAGPTPKVCVVIPGWHATRVIKLLPVDIPKSVLKEIELGKNRFHAMANKGAESAGELYVDWTE